jgi:hypothetical protein
MAAASSHASERPPSCNLRPNRSLHRLPHPPLQLSRLLTSPGHPAELHTQLPCSAPPTSTRHC